MKISKSFKIYIHIILLYLISHNLYGAEDFSKNIVIHEKPTQIKELKFKDSDLNDVSLKTFKNKVLLIVNVASFCGLTYQYKGLENIYKKYANKGLEILGFPCNQFAFQEPGTNEEIKDFCESNYGVTFRLSLIHI